MTDRLRTSRVDYEVQKFLNRLPYEPGDEGGPGSGEPDSTLQDEANSASPAGDIAAEAP